MLEFIEFNRILGASHFTFYHLHTSEEFKCILNYYERLGLVSIHPWSSLGLIDGVNTREIDEQTNNPFDIHFRNQVALHNDCNLRSMWKYDYAMHTNMDEFLLPTKEPNLISLLEKLERDQGSNVSAFSWIHGYHLLYWEDDEIINEEYPNCTQLPLYTLRKTGRSELKSEYNDSSKYIVKPEKAFMTHVHDANTLMAGNQILSLSPHDGILHHYR